MSSWRGVKFRQWHFDCGFRSHVFIKLVCLLVLGLCFLLGFLFENDASKSSIMFSCGMVTFKWMNVCEMFYLWYLDFFSVLSSSTPVSFSVSFSDKEQYQSLLDVSWWSETALILARCSGALTVSSVRTLKNLLGKSCEWFETSPRVTSAYDGGFLNLEVCLLFCICISFISEYYWYNWDDFGDRRKFKKDNKYCFLIGH